MTARIGVISLQREVDAILKRLGSLSLDDLQNEIDDINTLVQNIIAINNGQEVTDANVLAAIGVLQTWLTGNSGKDKLPLIWDNDQSKPVYKVLTDDAFTNASISVSRLKDFASPTTINYIDEDGNSAVKIVSNIGTAISAISSAYSVYGSITNGLNSIVSPIADAFSGAVPGVSSYADMSSNLGDVISDTIANKAILDNTVDEVSGALDRLDTAENTLANALNDIDVLDEFDIKVKDKLGFDGTEFNTVKNAVADIASTAGTVATLGTTVGTLSSSLSGLSGAIGTIPTGALGGAFGLAGGLFGLLGGLFSDDGSGGYEQNYNLSLAKQDVNQLKNGFEKFMAANGAYMTLNTTSHTYTMTGDGQNVLDRLNSVLNALVGVGVLSANVNGYGTGILSYSLNSNMIDSTNSPNILQIGEVLNGFGSYGTPMFAYITNYVMPALKAANIIADDGASFPATVFSTVTQTLMPDLVSMGLFSYNSGTKTYTLTTMGTNLATRIGVINTTLKDTGLFSSDYTETAGTLPNLITSVNNLNIDRTNVYLHPNGSTKTTLSGISVTNVNGGTITNLRKPGSLSLYLQDSDAVPFDSLFKGMNLISNDIFGSSKVDTSINTRVPPCYNYVMHWFDTHYSLTNELAGNLSLDSSNRVIRWFQNNTNNMSNFYQTFASGQRPTMDSDGTVANYIKFTASNTCCMYNNSMNLSNQVDATSKSATYDIFIVFKRISGSPAAQALLTNNNGGFNGWGLYASYADFESSTGGSYAATFCGNSSGSSKAFRKLSSGAPTGALLTLNNNQWYVMEVCYSTLNSITAGVNNPMRLDCWLDNIKTIENKRVDGMSANASGVMLGGYPAAFTTGQTAGGGADSFDGGIAEIIVYNRKLSDTERTSVCSYLQTKLGVPLSYSGA